MFRVDLRLRPQGREGDLAISLDGAREYYREHARDWELQALAKARHSAGDAVLARDFLESVQALIYRSSVNFAAIDSVLFARERISAALERLSSRHLGINVKLERGGIRDIEFLAQCLQRLYGGQQSWLRSGGTLFALQKLAEKGYLRQHDYGPLSRAYLFLRNVEHLLQLEHGQQTHRLPTSRDALAVLARRARLDQLHSPGQREAPRPAAALRGEAHDPQQKAAEALLAEVERHMKQVREIYDRLILAHSPLESPRPPVSPRARDSIHGGRARLPRAAALHREQLPAAVPHDFGTPCAARAQSPAAVHHQRLRWRRGVRFPLPAPARVGACRRPVRAQPLSERAAGAPPGRNFRAARAAAVGRGPGPGGAGPLPRRGRLHGAGTTRC